MEKLFYACSINQCNLFHHQMIGVVSIRLVRSNDRIIWWTWRYLPGHSNSRSMDARTDTSQGDLQSQCAVKEKILINNSRKYKQGWMPPPPQPPPPPLPSSLNFFWVLPWWHLSNWRLGDLVFPLFCALSIGRICSLMFRCVIQTFHVLALKFFFYLLVKKSFSLDLVVSFPSPSESLNCTWCTTKTHRNVYSRNARVPACSRVTWQIHLLGTSTWGHTCRSGCMLAPSPQKKSGRDSLSPFFSEGRGASVHRLDWWRKKSPSVLMQVMSKLSWKNNKKN